MGIASSLLVAILAAAPEQALSPRVTAVELRLPQEADRSLLKDIPSLLTVRAGQSFSRRLVQRSLEVLFATGRFSNIVAKATPEGSGVRLAFELTPVEKVAAIYVRGNSVIAEKELLAAAALAPGAEYFEEKVVSTVEAIRKLYFSRGYEQAQVRIERSDLGRGLEVWVNVDEGPPTQLASIRIGGVVGLPRPKVLQALGLVPGDVLDRRKLDEAQKRLLTYYRSEKFFFARIAEPMVQVSSGRATVFLPVSAGPQVDFQFLGNRNIPDGILERILNYDGSEVLDEAVSAQLSRKIEEFYRFRSFHDVRVVPRLTLNGSNTRARLLFSIEEGHSLFVREVVFVGNRAIASAELRNVLTEMVRASAPIVSQDVRHRDDPMESEGKSQGRLYGSLPEPEAQTVFVESAYANATKAMTDLYRARGFLSATVTLGGVTFDVAREYVNIRVDVQEGPLARVKSVEWKGVPSHVVLPSPLGLQPGQPFVFGRAEELRLELVKLLGRKGYLFAQAEVVPDVSDEGRDVVVRFQVSAGPEVRVGKVIVQGLERTAPWLVRNQMLLKEGDILDPESLYESQRRLVMLGVFRTVLVRLISPDAPEAFKDVVVEAKESPRLSGELGGGYFLAEGPRITFDWAYPNMGGLGLNVNGRGKVHYFGASGPVLTNQADVSDLSFLQQLGGQQTVSLQSRGLLPAEIGARLDVPVERVIFRFYRFTRAAALPSLDWERALPISGVSFGKLRVGTTLQYEIERVQLESLGALGQLLPTLASTDQSRLRFPEGTFALQSLRFSQTLDLRDNPTNPTRGGLLSFTAERTWDIFTQDRQGNAGAPIQTLRVSGNVSGYVPLGRNVVLAMSARAGRIVLLDPQSRTIAPKRFFLGGASSMRGFREDGVIPADRREDLRKEVAACRALVNPAGCTEAANALLSGLEVPSEGGELFVLGKSELRFPISTSFDLGLFVETGNLWLSPSRFSWNDLRYVVGGGIRWVTPIGPLVLDLGINPFRDAVLNEPALNAHFNIGLF